MSSISLNGTLGNKVLNKIFLDASFSEKQKLLRKMIHHIPTCFMWLHLISEVDSLINNFPITQKIAKHELEKKKFSKCSEQLQTLFKTGTQTKVCRSENLSYFNLYHRSHCCVFSYFLIYTYRHFIHICNLQEQFKYSLQNLL